MNEYRDLLERALRQFPPEPGVVERVMRRRDRRRRNQRIAAGALALIIATTAIGGLVSAFRKVHESRPASGTITPQNVHDLELSWTAKIRGHLATPVVSGSTVFAAGHDAAVGGTLYAFPTDCQTPPCAPLWTAHIKGFGDTPTVAGDIVYLASGTRTAGRMYAFPTTCGTSGAACRPLWTSPIGSPISSNDLGPVVNAGVVYIGTGATVDSPLPRMYAFPADCQIDRGTCLPLWTGATPLSPTSWVVAGQRLFVGTASGSLRSESFAGPRRGVLYAYPLGCVSTCRPTQEWRSLGRIWDLAAAGDYVYVGTDAGFTNAGPGLVQIQADCTSAVACAPRWHASTTCCTRVVVSGDLVFAHDERTAVYAFPTQCGDHGATCQPAWTSIVANPLYFGTPVVSNGLVFIGSGADGTVSALPVTCSQDCLPLWTAPAGDDVVGLAVANGEVFAASNGLYVFAPRVSRTAGADSNRSSAVFYGILAAIGIGYLGVSAARRRRHSVDIPLDRTSRRGGGPDFP